MKKSITLISIILLLFLAACSDGEVESVESGNDVLNEASENDKDTKGFVTEEEFDKMYSNPKDYRGYEVEFTAQVFVEPERDDTTVYLQVYAKPEDYEQNVIVYFEESDFNIKTDDYVKISGIVEDEFEGENLMGGTIIAPLIKATSVEVVDYITAVAPTLKEVIVDETITQHGMEVTLQKIEFAENETRAYVKVKNNTDGTVYFSEYDAKLLTGSSQFETEYIYESGLPEIPYDILAGVEAEGVLMFPELDLETDSITLHAEGYSDDYMLDFQPFVFEVEIE